MNMTLAWILRAGRITFILSALFATASCFGAGQLQVASSGQLGCRPDEITISDDNIGWSTRSYVAACHDRRYQCSGGRGMQLSCTRVDESTPPGKQAARASR